MARNEETKSVPGANTTNRQIAARMKPAAGEPDPRRDKRNPDPAASPRELTGLKSDGGEGVTPTTFILVSFPGRDESVPLPQNVHTRRRYDEAERRQVAATRKRGACEGCKKSKTKCNHSPEDTTFQQIQSHERFALGLTTPSLIENRDEHKHVMEEKIAEINNTLVKAQENISKPNGEVSGNEKMKTAASAVAPSLPEPSTPKSLSSQGHRPPPKVCHPQPRSHPPSSFTQGLAMFKLNKGQSEGQKRRRGNTSQTKKDGSATVLNNASGRKSVTARNTAKGPRPVVYQPRPMENVMTRTPAISASATTNIASVVTQIHHTISNCPISSHSRDQHGCMTFQESIIIPKSKMPAVASMESRQDQVMIRRFSRSSSDQESRVTASTESMLSFGRSQSPSSDRLPSESPAYVSMSDVERITFVEHFSFQKLLYDDSFSPSDDEYSPLDVSEILAIRPLPRVMEIPEDDTTSLDCMDLDADL